MADFAAILEQARKRAEEAKQRISEEPPAKRPQMAPPMQPAMAALMMIPGSIRSEEILIPNEHVGRVIGRMGDTINKIQEASGCRLQIQQDAGNPLRVGTMTGSEESIHKCKIVINQLLEGRNIASILGLPDDRASQYPVSTGREDVVKDIPILAAKTGVLVGQGGDRLQDLRTRAGCNIQIVDDPRSEIMKLIRLTGSQSAIELAERIVGDILDAEESNEDGTGNALALVVRGPSDGFSHGGSVADDAASAVERYHAMKRGPGDGYGGMSDYSSKRLEIPVPRSVVGSIIGRSGETIKRIQNESGARVQFDQADQGGTTPERICFISGAPAMVDHALKMVHGIVEDSKMRLGGGGGGGHRLPPGGIVAEFPVPAHRAGLIIGRSGETIKHFQAVSGAHVELNKENTDGPMRVFYIRGTPEQVETVKQLITEKLSGPDRMGMGGGGGMMMGGMGGFGMPPFGMPPFGMPPFGMPMPYGMPPQNADESGPDPPAPGYPTRAEYLANKEWYNSTGYFGVLPGMPKPATEVGQPQQQQPQPQQQQPQQQPQQQQQQQQQSDSAGADSAPQTDYSAQWTAYYAALAAMGGQPPAN